MIARLARYATLLFVIFVLAVWLPQFYTMLFSYRFGKTNLFYSPVIKQFVYTEMIGPDHQFLYRDQKGKDYDPHAFQALIPFIYYKNMEIWGKMPIEIDGHTFAKDEIRAARQVMELKAIYLGSHKPRIDLYPLLESDPGQARLRFPENVFRPDDELTFINSDFNRVDPDLTRQFGGALGNAGFAFPVQSVFGRVSILKAFDAGYFLTDSEDHLFHLMKVDGQAKVERVELPEGLVVRHIAVAENKRREILAMVLGQDNKLYLMRDDDYSLIKLDLPDYDPDRMVIKIIFNPLYRTAIYSDDQMVHAVAMDLYYRPVDHYSRMMAVAKPRLSEQIWKALTPFSLVLRDDNYRYFSFAPHFHGWLALIGSALSVLFAFIYLRLKRVGFRLCLVDLGLVLVTGLYGLVAILLFPPDPVQK